MTRLAQIAFLFLFATLLTLAFYLGDINSSVPLPRNWSLLDSMIVNFTGNYLWILFGIVIYRCVQKYRPEDHGWLMFLVVHSGLCIAVCYAHRILGIAAIWIVYHVIGEPFRLQDLFDQPYIRIKPWKVIYYGILLIVCYALDSFHRWKRQETSASVIEARLARAEFEAIKLGLNPAFLFHTLNAISDDMKGPLQRVELLIEKLGDFLRMVLRGSGQKEVAMEQELERLRCFLEIKKHIHNKFHFQMTITEGAAAARVPSLLLQPLQEILLHPIISGARTPNEMKISVIESNGALEIRLFNSGIEDVDPAAIVKVYSRIPGVVIQLEADCLLLSFYPGEGAHQNIETLPMESKKDPMWQGNAPMMRNTAPMPRWLFWTLNLSAWTLLGIMYYQGVIFYWLAEGWWILFPIYFSQWYIWATLTPFLLKLAERYPIAKGKRWPDIGVHLAANTVVCVGLGFWDLAINYGFPFFIQKLRWNELNLVYNLLLYWTIFFLRAGISFHNRYRESAARVARLQAQLFQARLRTLQMQIHPHFLFNTLNSISQLMFEDIAAARLMIDKLQHFLSLTLQKPPAPEVTLQEEIEFLRSYLDIQMTRFQNRLEVHIDIDEPSKQEYVPNLILQPIVENAIRYAAAAGRNPGRIEIQARKSNGRLRLQVRDNGPGFGVTPAQSREGLGIRNTRQRLQQYYGSGHDLSFLSSPGGGLQVTMDVQCSPRAHPVN